MFVLHGPAPNPDPGPFLGLPGSFPVASGSIKGAFGRLWELVRAFWAPWQLSGSFRETFWELSRNSLGALWEPLGTFENLWSFLEQVWKLLAALWNLIGSLLESF
jgi:hypothetical protein